MTGPDAAFAPDFESEIDVPRRYDFDETVRVCRFGSSDPTSRRSHNQLWKAARTPEGPVTLHLTRPSVDPRVVVRAWGPGAPWVLDRIRQFLGLDDDPSAFEPEGVLAEVARRRSGMHLSRSPWPWELLSAAILQQRVRFTDAAHVHVLLCKWRPRPAPGPVEGLLLWPDPAELDQVPAELWFRGSVEPRRVRALIQAAHLADRINDLPNRSHAEARDVLQRLAGCGPWTVEMTMGFALGDADAVPLGDAHMPHVVAWALNGEPRASDARMLELLEPYRPHRFRVLRMLIAEGIRPPGRVPRYGSRPLPTL